MKVGLSDQVVDFARRLPPEPRRRLRKALRDLVREVGDIVPLEGPLDGYCRFRVGAYRVILGYQKGNVIQCVFAERRSLLYELLLDVLGSPPS